MKRLYYIYKLILPNGKIYIGQTVDISRRFEFYRNLRCKYQIKLYESLKFYDWDLIKIEILYCNITNQEDIDKREEIFINSIPVEIRLNIRDSVKTFPKKKGKDSHLCKPIYQIEKDLKIIKKWNCLSEIEESLQINASNISKCILEKTYFAYGFYWCHESNYDKNTFKPVKKVNVNCIKIVQLTKRGVFIRIFNSISEAADYVKGLASNIGEVCRQKKASAYGFIWAYEENYLKEDFKLRKCLKISKKVKMFDLNDNFLKLFNSSVEAAEFLKISRHTIMRSCNNKINKPQKFKFQYE